jgi:cathepsin B
MHRFSERLCRLSKGAHNVQLSEQDVISCVQEGQFNVATTSVAQQVVRKAGTWTAVDGCQGGSGVGVWLQMFTDGRVTRSSSLYNPPYSAAGSSKVQCQDANKAGQPAYYANSTSLFRILSKNVAAIQAEILANGPVSAALSVYDDFMSYSGGCYTRTSSNLVGAHAVAIIGWGTDAGKDYWLFANSWVRAC